MLPRGGTHELLGRSPQQCRGGHVGEVDRERLRVEHERGYLDGVHHLGEEAETKLRLADRTSEVAGMRLGLLEARSAVLQLGYVMSEEVCQGLKDGDLTVAEVGLRDVAQAAQCPERASVGQAHGHPDVRAEVAGFGDGELPCAFVAASVTDHPWLAALRHVLAEALDQWEGATLRYAPRGGRSAPATMPNGSAIDGPRG